jgi:hypothetical protein
MNTWLAGSYETELAGAVRDAGLFRITARLVWYRKLP